MVWFWLENIYENFQISWTEFAKNYNWKNLKINLGTENYEKIIFVGDNTICF